MKSNSRRLLPNIRQLRQWSALPTSQNISTFHVYAHAMDRSILSLFLSQFS